VSESGEPDEAPTEPVRKESEPVEEQEAIPFAQFLESVPPSTFRPVLGLRKELHRSNGTTYVQIATPELSLHCTSDACNGSRFFRFENGDLTIGRGVDRRLTFLTYVCSNCRMTRKVFSLWIWVPRDADDGKCFKFGEYPNYGPTTPPRLLRMFGGERETFLRGRRCENQGLGIGAFAYYRRVVENQKNKIIDEIIKASNRIGAPPDVIEMLEKAKEEIQFSNALSSVKDVVPPALLINGHNPLKLLHKALSGGIHARTDEQCLERAHDVREVLAGLAERIGQALKDEAELNLAVSRLMKDD
jgi:hypothetical protein